MPTDDEISELKSELAEIKKWTRIQGLDTLGGILEQFDDTELVMFDAADGESTTREIGEAANVSRTTVSNRMDQWYQLGIVEKDGRQWKHLAPLSAMGIERPDIEGDEDD